MTRVLTTGVFDLFHIGHLRALEKAKSLGSYLMVGVCNDQVVTDYKRRPIIPFDQRLALVRAIRCVDEAIECPLWIEDGFYDEHRIDLHCQGDDPAGWGFYAVGQRRGILRIVGREPVIDTTRILAEVARRQTSTEVDATV